MRRGSQARYLSGHVLLVSLVLLASIPVATEAAAAAPEVRLYDSMTLIRGSQALPASSFPGIFAARNEFESFQVAVQADTALSGVSVELDGPFQRADGVALDASHVTIYREQDYVVPTDYLSDSDSLSVGGAGGYPDALIPEVDPYRGENRGAFPAALGPGGRLTAWVDVFVPAGQAPGDYATNVIVSSDGQPVVTRPVTLRVMDFAIPSKATLDNAYFVQDMSSICKAHYNTADCGDKQKMWELAGLYGKAALDNRLTIANIAPLGQDGGPPTGPNLAYFDQFILPLIDGSDAELRLSGARMTTQSVYTYAGHHCNDACTDAWETFAAQKGYGGRFVLYACDEAGGSQAAWDACAANGLGRATASPKLATAAVQDAEAVGYLDQIDILVANVRNLAAKPGYRFAGNQRPAYDGFLANNTPGTPANRLWLYHACDSMSCTQIANSQDEYWDHPLYAGWPSHGIDQPTTFARTMGWLIFAYDASGELYWEVAQRLKTAWTDQFEHGAQGDGNLFYPGRPATVAWEAGAPGIGGGSHIPIESIRLKRIRDGREDYEYMHYLAATLGRRPEAKAIVAGLVGSLDSATYSVIPAGSMADARCALARAITGMAECYAAGFDPGPDPDPDPEVTQHPRGITLSLKHRDGRLIARGGIYVDDGFFTCSQEQTVTISRNGAPVATPTTNFSYSAFKVKLPHRAGRYKAYVAPFNNGTDSCPEATAKVRHRH